MIREMLESDVPRVLEIERASFDAPWSEGMLRDDLGRSDRVWRVVEIGGRIVGFGGIMLIALGLLMVTGVWTALMAQLQGVFLSVPLPI